MVQAPPARKLCNDEGKSHIEVDVKEFECIGASAPFDHPHIFLDMGKNDTIICPYCSTVFVYNNQAQTLHNAT